MIESFRSLFAPPRHMILVAVALWLGLTLAEKRTERYGVSKEQLNNIAFYSLFGFILGFRIFPHSLKVRLAFFHRTLISLTQLVGWLLQFSLVSFMDSSRNFSFGEHSMP